ncbi:MAG: hypothetical protein V1831_00215 [Candidatus Woesearchaeota archaeon]
METTLLNDSYLMEKKFELMIESINKRVANELNALKNMICNINSEVAEIKKQLNNVQKASPAVFENSNNSNSKVANVQLKSRDNVAVKPRYGDYAPEDVPIEKFFYFGNKKIR